MANNVSPCSDAAEKIATKFDAAIIAGDPVALGEHINEALTLVESEDEISKATIYYCLGTAYGALDSIGETNTEESLKKQIYFFRKSIALLETVECSAPDFSLHVKTYNPQLERIKKVRHALEHKYVKITKGWFPDRENGEIDDLALYVNETELYDLTMQLMHIVREVIICLTMCVHAEEKSQKKENGDQLVMPMPLMEYDDNWKI